MAEKRSNAIRTKPNRKTRKAPISCGARYADWRRPSTKGKARRQAYNRYRPCDGRPRKGGQTYAQRERTRGRRAR